MTHSLRTRTSAFALLVIAGLCLTATTRLAVAQDPSARILDLRWRYEGEATAVTVRLSAPVRYRTASLGLTLALDLWTVDGGAEQEIPMPNGIAAALAVRQLTPEVVRLSLSVREPARMKVFTRDDLLTVVAFPNRQAGGPLPQTVAYSAMRVPTGAGHAQAHVVTIDPRAETLAIQPALGGAVVAATEPTSAVATRLEAVAAINGNFFTRAGLPVGLLVIDGRVLSAPLPRRAVFGIDDQGRPWIGTAEFSGRLVADTGVVVPISAINRPPRWSGVAVYTPEFGPRTPDHVLVATVREDRLVELNSGRAAIPHDGYALAAAASQQHLLLRLVRGQQVRLDVRLEPEGIQHAIQGGPRLARDGQILIPYAWEGFGQGFYRVRTARSAVGITHAGKVLFVTVDRPGRGSTGVNLPELAALMLRLGARDAMNLDGGGSATLVVGGRVVSALPRGGERTVSAVLVAVPRAVERSP